MSINKHSFSRRSNSFGLTAVNISSCNIRQRGRIGGGIWLLFQDLCRGFVARPLGKLENWLQRRWKVCVL